MSSYKYFMLTKSKHFVRQLIEKKWIFQTFSVKLNTIRIYIKSDAIFIWKKKQWIDVYYVSTSIIKPSNIAYFVSVQQTV